MEDSMEVFIGKYKVTGICITESWENNRMVYTELDKSKVMTYSVMDSKKRLSGKIIIFKRHYLLKKLSDGKIATSQNDTFCYSVIHSNFPMNCGSDYYEYSTIGIYMGNENDLIEFFRKEMSIQRAADIERYTRYAKEEFERRQQSYANQRQENHPASKN